MIIHRNIILDLCYFDTTQDEAWFIT